MCGIAGIVDAGGRAIDRGALERLRDCMVHRGPDDAGIHIDGAVGLASRRLAVIDLTQAGHQPMTDPDERAWIVHNGEVYNFQEVRLDLERRGHRFRSRTDTEVVLHAYLEWGTDCLDRFVGMFAFAIWDPEKQQLFAARDRLGVKPFCYTVRQGRMVFASEVHGLYEHVEVVPEAIDPLALDYYLANGYVPPDRGFVKGINKLPPAHAMLFGANGVRTWRYWEARYRPLVDVSYPDALDMVEESLRTAVRRRLTSDVPLGCFLSGGIDSGLVAAFAADALPDPLRTFTVRFEGASEDESEHGLAALVAEKYGTDHTELTVSHRDRQILPDVAWHFGEPFADISSLAVHQISAAARGDITVALTGDGGDESFCGYANVRAARVAQAARPFLPAPVRGFVHGLARLVGNGAGPVGRADRWLHHYVARSVLGQYDVENQWNSNRRSGLYRDGSMPEPGAVDVVRTVQKRADGLSDAEVHLFTDLSLRLPGDYLTKVDIASNMASLEIRSPYLDHELVEVAAQIPLAHRMRRGRQKALLRDLAARHLPPEVVSAPKRGFGPPLGRWLRGDWADMVETQVAGSLASRPEPFDGGVIRAVVSEHRRGVRDHGRRIWILLALELWWQLFIDRSLAPSDSL